VNRLGQAIPAPVKDVLRPLYRRLRAPAAGERPPGLPSDGEKHATIVEYAEQYGCRVLVETGTYEGGTVAVVGDRFDAVFTIELNPELHRRAVRRFRHAANVQVIHGDSSEELERLLPSLDRPTLFWLDAHYSRGGAPSAKGKYDPPLMFELGAILALHDPRHVVLIDDARCCGVEAGWPTVAELEALVRSSGLDLALELRHDLVRIHRRDP
jgi:hypothetical protein